MNNYRCNQDILDLVKTIKLKLDKNNIQFWLDEGTLLGAIRNNNIIKGDVDIDFSTTHNNLPKLLEICNFLKQDGYYIKYQKHLPFVEDLIQIYPKNRNLGKSFCLALFWQEIILICRNLVANF